MEICKNIMYLILFLFCGAKTLCLNNPQYDGNKEMNKSKEMNTPSFIILNTS